MHYTICNNYNIRSNNKMKGIIKSIRKDKTGAKIDDDWYKFSGEALLKLKQDEIYGYEIEYYLSEREDKTVYDYKKLEKKSYNKAEINKRFLKDNIDWDSKDKRIARQACIKASADAYNLSDFSNDYDAYESRLLSLAEKFFDYVYKDHDHPGVNQDYPTQKDVKDGEGEVSTSLPPPSSLTPEHEDFIVYKSKHKDNWAVKAIWVDYAIQHLGYDTDKVLSVWEAYGGKSE